MKLKGFQHSLKNLIKELSITLRHFIGMIKSYRYIYRTDLKLNLGCGTKVKHGWINIDLGKEADITLDLRERFPFRDNSCKIIYSEHFLEHLKYPKDVVHFLRETYRVLLPGGIFSVGVPDTEWILVAYATKSDHYFKFAKELWHPEWCQTRMEHINYHFRQNNEHLFAYDYETLKHALKMAGFTDIKRRNFNPEFDSKDREIGTLYVDAVKAI